MRILVIEDEERVALPIKKGLEELGFDITVATDGSIGKRLALSEAFDLIITDILLPKVNGLELCKLIRQELPDMPIIMLTALGTTDDKVEGFDAGANDYLVKPFDFRELYVRIRELLKRVSVGGSGGAGAFGFTGAGGVTGAGGAGGAAGSGQGFRKAILTAGDLEMNLRTGIVRRGDKEVSLTRKEFKLLEYMMNNQGRVLSRTEIAEHVWETSFDTGTNFIDVYINYLRKKIDRDHTTKLIHTRPGIGFIFNPQP